MILTLHGAQESLRYEIDASDFLRLRRGELSEGELLAFAERYRIPSEVLLEYAKDLRGTIDEAPELEGACDYTDHFA